MNRYLSDEFLKDAAIDVIALLVMAYDIVEPNVGAMLAENQVCRG